MDLKEIIKKLSDEQLESFIAAIEHMSDFGDKALHSAVKSGDLNNYSVMYERGDISIKPVHSLAEVYWNENYRYLALEKALVSVNHLKSLNYDESKIENLLFSIYLERFTNCALESGYSDNSYVKENELVFA
jgi:hypothetical protein